MLGQFTNEAAGITLIFTTLQSIFTMLSPKFSSNDKKQREGKTPEYIL